VKKSLWLNKLLFFSIVLLFLREIYNLVMAIIGREFDFPYFHAEILIVIFWVIIFTLLLKYDNTFLWWRAEKQEKEVEAQTEEEK